jgi:hypothetical protein
MTRVAIAQHTGPESHNFEPTSYPLDARRVFNGMVQKAKTGDLNLGRTVWGLRQAAASQPRRDPPPAVTGVSMAEGNEQPVNIESSRIAATRVLA